MRTTPVIDNPANRINKKRPSMLPLALGTDHRGYQLSTCHKHTARHNIGGRVLEQLLAKFLLEKQTRR